MTRRIGTTSQQSRRKTAKGPSSRNLERRAKAGSWLERRGTISVHVTIPLQLTCKPHRRTTAVEAVLPGQLSRTKTAQDPLSRNVERRANAGRRLEMRGTMCAHATVPLQLTRGRHGGTTAVDAVLPGDAAIAVVRTVATSNSALMTAATAVRGARIAGMTAEGMDGTVTVPSAAVAWNAATIRSATETIREDVAAGDLEVRTATLVNRAGSVLGVAARIATLAERAGGVRLGAAARTATLVAARWRCSVRLGGLQPCHVVVPVQKTVACTVLGQLIVLQRLMFWKKAKFWTEGELPVAQLMLFWMRLENCGSVLGSPKFLGNGSEWNARSRR